MSELSNITINNCKFYSNQINGKNLNKNDDFVGGSAAFICSRNINVSESKLVGNKGSKGTLKIYNKFYENDAKTKTKNLLENNQNSIIISNCDFELNDASKKFY